MSEEYLFVADSPHRRFLAAHSGGMPIEPANAYGKVLVRRNNGEILPVTCNHGGSMWLCASCAELMRRSSCGSDKS